MSFDPPIVVTGLGAVTPVGLSVPASCAALRAGVCRMKELATHMVEGPLADRVPVIGGRVPTEWFEGGPVIEEWPGHERFELEVPLPLECYVGAGVERLVELAAPAAREAWIDARPAAQAIDRIGLYLGVASEEEAGPVVEAVREVVGRELEPVVVKADGRAAALAAVGAATGDLGDGEVGAALVGGVDSLIRKPVLERLDAEEILRSSSRPQGLIPGEAAAFAFLETAPRAEARGAEVLARVLAVATEEEPTVGTDDPNQAEGLTVVLSRLRRVADSIESPPLVVCDLNGDRYRAQEWSMASLRTRWDCHQDLPIWHPADCIGDTGAASGALNLVWAVSASVRGYAPSDDLLVWGASEGKLRAGALLATAPAEEKED